MTALNDLLGATQVARHDLSKGIALTKQVFFRSNGIRVFFYNGSFHHNSIRENLSMSDYNVPSICLVRFQLSMIAN